jgi:ABC-type glycerol-3-phosphate transport system permease component
VVNGLQLFILALFVVFVALFLKNPRNPKRALNYGRGVLLTAACTMVILPFVWLIAAIFKDPSVFNKYIFFPPLSEWSTDTINLHNLRRLFEPKESLQGTVYFWQYLLNSTLYASVTTVVQAFFASMAGYALAKYRFRGRNALTVFMLGSMMIPGVLLLAPVYGMAVGWGLVDSLWGLMVPNLVSAYGIFLFRQAILGVPDELLDAGRLDGCSEFQIYYRLVMPLVRPMTAAFCLVVFLSQWNSFFMPNVFLHSETQLTLPIVLNLYLSDYVSEYGVYLAGTALAIIPPAILFIALQKEFIQGLTTGAVKG